MTEPPPKTPAPMRFAWRLRVASSVLALAGCGASLKEVQGWTRRCDRAALAEGLRSERSWIRRSAAFGAGRCGLGSERGELERRALDPDEARWVRAAAVHALGQLQDPASLDLLVGLAADPGLEPEIQVEVIVALERYRASIACDALAPLAGRDEPLVAARAALALSGACEARGEG